MILCLAGIGYGQYNPDQVNKKAANLYMKALQIASEGEYREGIRLLQEATRLDKRFLDAYLSLGGIHGELKEYAPAVENYEKAREIDSVYFRDYALPYSINLAGKGEFEKALLAVSEF